MRVFPLAFILRLENNSVFGKFVRQTTLIPSILSQFLLFCLPKICYELLSEGDGNEAEAPNVDRVRVRESAYGRLGDLCKYSNKRNVVDQNTELK